MKYIVINAYDGKILNLGVLDTITEAIEIMKNDFMSVFLEHYDKEDFENKVGYKDNWDIGDTTAWLYIDGYICWEIFEV